MSMKSSSPFRFSKLRLPVVLGTLTLVSLTALMMPVAAQSARAKAAIDKLVKDPLDLSCAAVRERGRSSDSAIIAKPLPHDSRLVIFPYDKNALFPINTIFNRFTHFEFESGEKILAS